MEQKDKIVEAYELQKSKSALLLETYASVIDDEQFSPMNKKFRMSTALLIENMINEDANLHTDLQFFKDMKVPIFRESMSKTHLLEVVGFQPLNQASSFFYVERFYYGGNDANGTDALLTNLDRGLTADPIFDSNVVRIEMNAGQYASVVVGTSHIKVAGGGGNNLAKIVYKEEAAGGGKFLVKIQASESLPAVGTVYVTGPNADLNMSNVWNNEIGRSVILSNYGGPMTTSEGEVLNDWLNLKISLERVEVKAESHKLAFELSQETITDLANITGDDAKQRLVTAINWQLAMSINRKLFNLMTSNAEISTAWSYATGTGRPGSEFEKFMSLRRKIKYEQNRIAVKTQMGRGNFALITPKIATVLEMQTGFSKSLADDGGDQAGIIKVGNLDGINYYMTTMDAIIADFMMVGYKGNDDSKAGVFYCPYESLRISHANDFNNPERQKVAFSQRAGYRTNPFGAERYLTFFDVDLTGSSIA